MGSHEPLPGTSIRERLLFVALLACALLARAIHLFHHATMPDEAFTFFIASQPFPVIIDMLKNGDFHPPLVYLIGHGLFALSNRAYLFRIVSVIFGVAGVAATYALARRAIPRWASLATLFVAINPSLVFFDGLFRMYALLWSLCMISWALLLWAIDEPRRAGRWVAYAFCLAMLLYTQYLAFFTLAAQIAYVGIFYPRRTGFWLSVAGALVAFAPWVPILLIQYPQGGTAYNAMQGHLVEMWQAAPVLLVDGLPSALEFSPLLGVLLWVAIIAGLGLGIVRRRWLVLALLAPLAIQILYSLVSGKLLLGQRYLLQAIPALVFVLLVAVDALWQTRLRPLALGFIAAIAVMMTAGIVDKHFLAEYMPVDWTTYRRFLDAKMQANDGVVFDGSMTYYALIGSKAAKSPSVFLIADPDQAAKLATKAATLPRVWFIDYESELSDPQRVAFSILARTHPRHVTWRSTKSGYGDFVLTTLFLPPNPKRGP
ncbi:MAG TPA: glycosyltransferase family 39 protein [Candidatus Acidoferrales bacterium]|nr:glycosyltransferase family 39 protein [Candidatus Acidoferrales bacterium]